MDKSFLSPSGRRVLHAFTLEGQWAPFPLKYLCQQFDKCLEVMFVKSVCFPPAPVPTFHTETSARRGAQRQLLNFKFTLNFSSLMHHDSYRNKQTKKRGPCMKSYFGSCEVLSPFPALMTGYSPPMWSRLLGMGCPSGSRGRELLRSLSMNVLSTKTQV